MKVLFLFTNYLIFFTNGFCEMERLLENRENLLQLNFSQHNLTHYNFTRNELLAYGNNHEIVNAVSSLIYSIYGIIGLMYGNKDLMYVIVMHLFVLMGITSCLHHYYYIYSWAHSSDIICVELITTYSTIYLYFGNSLKLERVISKIFIFLLLGLNITMLVYNNIDLYARTIMIQVNIGLIIIYRIYMAHFTFYKMPHDFKMICRSSLIDCTTFGLMVFAFYGDILLCPTRIHDFINIHASWHVFSCISLFNCINNRVIFYAECNDIIYVRRAICKRCNYLFYIISLKNKRSHMKNSATNIELDEIRLINPGFHRRIKSFG